VDTLFTIDDEELILRSLVRILRRSDRQVFAFSNAREALEQVDLRPSLVITDYHMPGIDGLELVVHMKAASPGTRFVLLTGGIIDERIGQALESGLIDQVVRKPWQLGEFLALVEGLLEAGRSCAS
jgi:two-component system response regulator FixJ